MFNPQPKVKTKKLSQIQKDKIVKKVFCMIYYEWLTQISTPQVHFYQAMDKESIDDFSCFTAGRLHLDHVKNRSTHPELKYCISNMQLITPEANFLKKEKGEETDYRSKEFKKFLKQFPIKIEFE